MGGGDPPEVILHQRQWRRYPRVIAQIPGNRRYVLADAAGALV